MTPYVGGNDPEHKSCGDAATVEKKKKMTKTLSKHLMSFGYYVCISSHSRLDEETQENCHAFLYDSHNCWQIDGIPSTPYYGVAEMTATHNAINYLESLGFKKFFKLCYDENPTLDYGKLIQKFDSYDKKLVTFKNSDTLGSMAYFCEIDFYRKTSSINEIYRLNNSLAIERMWFDSIQDKGLWNDVHGFGCYYDMLELDRNLPLHYSDMSNVRNDAYNF